jgi:preprotein translocase subunit YajC
MFNQLFINNAAAQEAATAATQNEFSLSSFVPITLIFFIFYFLIIRPQSKKIKDHQKLVNELKNGNKIVTSSGIFGVIKEVEDDKALVELADGFVVKMLKTHISEVVNEEKAENKKSKKALKNHKK